jgi:hypothetical protein
LSQSGSSRRNIQDSPSVGSNVEEEILAALVAADEILQEALRLYDNLERDAVKQQAEQVSQRFVSAKVSHIFSHLCPHEFIIHY